MVVSITKYFGWTLDQLDVVTAFLYGEMKEKVFCAIPEGVEVDEDFDCFEFVKAIYGLKQASRVWNETFHEFWCIVDRSEESGANGAERPKRVEQKTLAQ
uniref:Reverse transcriptase Ty1/copia-type domain-containing protein n=1 Tax=Peronospora matthiolae TaxID=2874970 RepID=A0AAV1UAV3_9STRA